MVLNPAQDTELKRNLASIAPELSSAYEEVQACANQYRLQKHS